MLSQTLHAIMSGDTTQAPLGTILELNKALRNNADWVSKGLWKGAIGTVQQGTAFGSLAGSELAPLVPQSIAPNLVSATYTKKHLVLWPMLYRLGVKGPLHEANVLTDYNDDVDPWMAEGGGGTTVEDSYERRVVNIRLLARRAVINDFAATVGITGFDGLVDRGMLALRTTTATTSLLGSLETALFLADSALTPRAFDGLYKQIVGQVAGTAVVAGTWYNAGLPYRRANDNNYYDMRGSVLPIQDLIGYAFELSADPTLGYANTCFVEPRVYGAMVKLAQSHARSDANRGGKELHFDAGKLWFQGAGGEIEVKPATKMFPRRTAPTATKGQAPPPSNFAADYTITAAAGAASQFTSTDAGSYIYQLVAVGDLGQTAAATTAAQAVLATQKITIDVQELVAAKCEQGATADTATVGKIRYFRVYRSSKDGAAATCSYMWSYPVNTSGAGSNGTLIVDENYHLPNTAPVYLLEFNEEVLYFAQLLDLMRRPLHSLVTEIPFLVMLFGSLHVRIPTKCMVIDNCALTV